jgi:hypothetical protein
VKPAAPPIPTGDELRKLIDRAQDGDAATLPTLRKMLENPATVDSLGGDLAFQAQAMLIRKFSGKNLLLKEALPRKLDLMRAELSGPNPSPLERLLVERIVACWLHLHQLEATYHSRDNVSFDMGNYYQSNIQRAQKGYLSAIKALATVRKLALPAIQVNVAKRQVNVLNAHNEAGNAE